ncbi:AP-1-like transcription factor [Pleurostoma richardsiae]|uniref:AP-1-like transcription factor n=1 Tax=Pleurostoma richardsiae TaxID=41990 RepID=A0AA38R833_9PEZI|nr:AP-1-like transcription factor [Pleurostoma richardsiae]
MTSSVSPAGGVGSTLAYGGTADAAEDSKSPLSSLNLGFLRTLQDKRTTREGNPPKRRGPKPDSKPALTRRQELNRQAQRTHRERKELYIKALEDEVLRLKEVYANVSQDKDRLAEENRQLKALLAQQQPPQHGLPPSMSGLLTSLDDTVSNPASATTGYGGSVSGASVSGGGAASSHTSAFTPPPLSALGGGGGSGSGAARGVSPGGSSLGHGLSPSGGSGQGYQQQQQQQRNPAIDYEQAGIDFVLTLEKPCMDHLPWLLERDSPTGAPTACGHALMASCPPEPFSELTPDIPFGYANVRPLPPAAAPGDPLDSAAAARIGAAPGGAAQQQELQRTWELSKADLATLLDLSKRLNLDGEITPVMAWGMVLAHPRLGELKPEDFRRLAEELGGKIRCYGFGAVMEEFEVRDALENIFSVKPEAGYYTTAVF